jgi:tetratricopeptide (TPR) repeat protein
MANKGSDTTAPGAAATRRSLLGRLSGLAGGLRKNPLRGGIAIAVGLLVIGGAAYATSKFLPAKAKAPQDLLTEALARLDAGDFTEARRLAAESRARAKGSHQADGGTLFVLGVALAHDAKQDLNPTERRTLNLIAARYLEEARYQGLPEGREPEAMLILGRCLHGGGRYAAAIPVLRDLHLDAPEQVREVHQLLADSYLHLSPPSLAKALAENEKLLALPDLSPRERDLARIQQAEILIEQQQWDRALALLAEIANDSPVHPQALLMSARITLRDANKRAKSDQPPADDLQASIDELLAKLTALQSTDNLPPDQLAQVQLLVGLCQLGKGEDAEAATQLSKVRRAFAGRPEALLAMLYEAELLQQKGDPQQALALYKRLVQEAGSAETYHNPLLPLRDLDVRLGGAISTFLASQQYEAAVDLASVVTPLLSDVRQAELLAKAQIAWGDHLAKSASADLALRGVTEAEARQHYRDAGAQLERLAELRIATRKYLDDLAASAANYLRGQGYRQAIRVYRKLLEQQTSANRPEALTGLGEALLAAGEPAEALVALDECREMYPNHPATYRARLLGAQALEEQGKIDEAQALLTDNLYKFALTPQSSDWRDSLFALGNLLYRSALTEESRSRLDGVDSDDVERRKSALVGLEKAHNLFRDAIKTLTEAVNRYPSAPQSTAARYQIAECYRHAAKWPRKRLSIITVETTRVALHRQMQRDLQSAVDEYQQLISLLGDDSEPHRSALERSILRNAYFARGDALFDLGKYEDAIKAYSAATNRFQHEPEALEAYVQIAACYRRLNRPVEARGTLEQARVVLSRIRPDADFLRTTNNTRQQWGDLLTWLASL